QHRQNPIALRLFKSTICLSDNGFAHLFLVFQWNLMCRSKSVETLNLAHLHASDDSVGVILNKTKTNQDTSGPPTLLIAMLIQSHQQHPG
ncbi:TPA: hypothetical protein N0F65_006570, partial [Lagenidium giganteum]